MPNATERRRPMSMFKSVSASVAVGDGFVSKGFLRVAGFKSAILF